MSNMCSGRRRSMVAMVTHLQTCLYVCINSEVFGQLVSHRFWHRSWVIGRLLDRHWLIKVSVSPFSCIIVLFECNLYTLAGSCTLCNIKQFEHRTPPWRSCLWLGIKRTSTTIYIITLSTEVVNLNKMNQEYRYFRVQSFILYKYIKYSINSHILYNINHDTIKWRQNKQE